MRTISADFMSDLKNDNGLLHPILERVKQDDTLMLAIRENYINIYYRGGNILRVKEIGKHSYIGSFDDEYNHPHKPAAEPGTTIKRKKVVKEWAIRFQDDAKDRAQSFFYYKGVMDHYFARHQKPEREFQQLVARENNCSTISNSTEYFISDIEITDAELSARFDMSAVRWLASQRKNGATCRATLIEMKYADGSIGGTTGILKHLRDMDKLISQKKETYKLLLKTIEEQFNQLASLDLLGFNQCTNETKVKLDPNDKPEVIFILANHNPRSTQLREILAQPEIMAFENSPTFDLKFFVSTFAGYGLHADGMLPLTEFRELLNRLHPQKELS